MGAGDLQTALVLKEQLMNVFCKTQIFLGVVTAGATPRAGMFPHEEGWKLSVLQSGNALCCLHEVCLVFLGV